MFHVITGGSGSGKSAYAEEQLQQLAGELSEVQNVYLATMEPFGEETLRKIERHKRMRAGKGFQTVECYVGLADCARSLEETYRGTNVCVLLECISNLTANERYRPDGAGEQTKEAIIEGVRALRECCTHVVVVTNEVCSDGRRESEEMVQYKRTLAEVNAELARMADAVTEVIYGIPVEKKR